MRNLRSATLVAAAFFWFAACTRVGQLTPLSAPAPAVVTPIGAASAQSTSLLASDPILKDLPLPDAGIKLVRNDGKYREQRGKVSLYRHAHGEKTASGMPYRREAMTAAHRSLPFYTIVRCTRTDTGQSVVVMINDRGPFIRGRVLDVTPAAATRLDLHDDGVAPCRIEVIAYPKEDQKVSNLSDRSVRSVPSD